MKKTVLLFVALFVMIAHAVGAGKKSQMTFSDAETVTLELVSGGMLQEKMASVDSASMKKLILRGTINSDDMVYIRSLTALVSIDLSGITKMEHGTQPYYSFYYHKIMPGHTNQYYLSDRDSTWSKDAAFNMGGGLGKTYSPAMHFAFCDMSNLKEIILPSSMTELGRNIMSGTSVEHVVLPENVKKIGGGAFYSCTSLKYIDGLEHVSELVGTANANGSGYNHTFNNCSSFVGNSTEHVLDLSSLDSIGDYTFSGCSSISEVRFSDSLYYVGKQAFSKCSSLNNIVFTPSLRYVGSQAFFKCTSLSRVTIPDRIDRLYGNSFSGTPYQESLPAVNGVYYIGSMAVTRQPNMESLTFREGTTYIVEYFEATGKDNKQKVSAVTLPSSIKRIGDNFFSGLGTITTLDLPEGLEEIGGGTLDELTEITLPSSLKSFHLSMKNIKTLTIPEIVENAELTCNSLETLYFNARRVNSFSASCNSLKKFVVGAKVAYLPPYCIGSSLPLLEKVEFAKRNATDTLYIGGSVFPGCVNLSSISLPEGVTTIGYGAFAGFEKFISLPSTVKVIGKNAFSGTKQSSFNLPSGLLSIGENAFSGCSITSVVIPKSLRYMGQSAFNECMNLKSITWNATKLTDIPDYAFENCLYLESISSLSGVKRIGAAAFKHCQLKSISLPSTLETIGEQAFDNCDFTSIIFGKNIKHIGNGAFRFNQELTRVTFRSTEQIEDIGLWAFDETPWMDQLIADNQSEPIYLGTILLWASGVKDLHVKEGTHLIAGGSCIGVGNITFPLSLRYIGSGAFYGSNMYSIEIPEGVERIGNGAFSGLSQLYKIVLPSTINYIGRNALAMGGAKLYARYVLYCGATTPPVSEDRIFSISGYIASYEHRVPEEAVEAYRANPYWGNYTLTGEPEVLVNVKNAVREYGEENPEVEYETTDEGEPEISCEANKKSPVGVYPLRMGRGTLKTYRPRFTESTLTIEKAPLVFYVDNVERQVGEENPVFRVYCRGWKNGEGKSVLTSVPVATTTATKDSPAGKYPITVSGGEAENYSFEYIDGELTVTEPTGIDGTSVSSALFDVYTVNGQKVRSQVSTLYSLPKGVYIVRGEKVVVR